MSEIEFYHSENTSTVVKFDLVDLKHFLLQTAASLIVGCKTYSTEENKYPENSAIGREVMRYTDFAPHGYVNTLLMQAEFIRAYVKSIVALNHRPYLLERPSAHLIAQSLKDWQTFKTALIKDEEKNHGEGFGNATAFNKADWSEYNEKFLALWDK